MKKILLPTDFSRHSFNAIVYALQLFEKAPYQFFLFHAYSIPSSVGVLISVDKILEEEALEKLDKHEKSVKEHLAYPPIELQKITAAGSFHELLPEIVHTYNIDLVLMGTKGASNIASSIIGTYTSHAINELQCPLLVIPSDAYFDKMASVVFATDHQNNQDHLDGQWFWVDWVIKNYAPTFTKLHVDKPEEATHHTTPKKSTEIKPLPAVVACHELEETAYHEDVVDGIANYVTSHKADMVVLVAHQRGWLGRLFHRSVTQQLAMRNLAPLLILRDKKS